MNGDLSLSQALGGLRIANPDDAVDSAGAAAAAPHPQLQRQPQPQPQLRADSSKEDRSTNQSTRSYEPEPAEPSLGSSNDERRHQAGSSEMAQTETASVKIEASFTAVPELSIFSNPTHYDLGDPSSSFASASAPASAPFTSPAYMSREPSQNGTARSHDRSRPTYLPPQSGNLPLRKSSKGMGGGYVSLQACSTSSPFSGEGPVPTTSEEWKDRGAAVGVRREVDSSGRTVVRQVKKGVRDFSFGRVLGEGSYSTVYIATDRQTLKEYAIKVLEKRHIIKEKKIKYVNIEKNTLNRLTEHPGIVRLYYTFQDETSLYYVLDLCNGGELLGVLKKTGTFDVECTRFYGAEILDAISYMHSRGVIHRDLKPENVLLNNDMHVKITDFGTAKLLKDPRETMALEAQERGIPEPPSQDDKDDSRAASFVGTAEYVSPELLTSKSACKASDLWAFGCIIYQLLAGRPPFKAGSEYLTFQKIVNLEYEFPPGFPLAARDLVERCLVLDPARRLTVEHIKNHEFFDGQHFGKTLWRTKPPRLRPYVPSAQESTVIQLNGYSGTSAPSQIARSPSKPQTHPSHSSSSRPARIITELPPPTQLDLEWSPVLTKTNERILRLGDLNVLATPLPNGQHGKGVEEGHKKISRFFGGSTTKKRQRLVLVTSSGRIVLAAAGGEDKRPKQELSLIAPDCSWKSQQDVKGQVVWCVDSVRGSHAYPS